MGSALKKSTYRRDYYLKNRKRILARCAVYHAAHVDERRAYAKKYRKVRNSKIRAYVRKAKSRPCTDCRRRYPSYVMDFDHVKGKKVGAVTSAKLLKRGLRFVIKEIAKCELVCANCHRERTHQRRVGKL